MTNKVNYMIDNYDAPPTFLGRNGGYIMAGIEITKPDRNNMITLKPTTRKNKTGRSWLQIPMDKVEDVIYALAEEAGYTADLWKKTKPGDK